MLVAGREQLTLHPDLACWVTCRVTVVWVSCRRGRAVAFQRAGSIRLISPPPPYLAMAEYRVRAPFLAEAPILAIPHPAVERARADFLVEFVWTQCFACY